MGKRKRLGTIIPETTTTCSSSSSDNSNSSNNKNSNNNSECGTTSSNSGASHTSKNNNITLNKDNIHTNKPTCSICIQPFIRRTFLQPCCHSFCFTCIRQWINIVPNCPLCKEAIDSLVYNMDETNNTFQEYVLHDHDHHHPSPDPPPTTLKDRILPLRRQMYHHTPSFRQVIYPPVAHRFARVHYILPEHIPKVSTFLAREIPAIMSKTSDSYTEQHIKAILLTPYETNKQRIKSSTSTSSSTNANKSKAFSFSPSPSRPSTPTQKSDTQSQGMMSMYDPTIIQELGEWLTIGAKDLNAETVARRFLDEIMAFIKSGMDYWTFVDTVKYEE
ncbi:hypothetical protein BDA99DRAFT_600902 [Phascolomyces articulosus]|uniref:RING-type domain-containing protein n=1 Tax=Phascolomyces articulosus TaxID=60185 RepID=A0AAD5KBL1_9FUNG|nr:hypothetical protein BDA99DRAFT_600902 [Phascolomyces articulosus]